MFRVNVIIKRPNKTDRQIVCVCKTVEESETRQAYYAGRYQTNDEQTVEIFIDEITDEQP